MALGKSRDKDSDKPFFHVMPRDGWLNGTKCLNPKVFCARNSSTLHRICYTDLLPLTVRKPNFGTHPDGVVMGVQIRMAPYSTGGATMCKLLLVGHNNPLILCRHSECKGNLKVCPKL